MFWTGACTDIGIIILSYAVLEPTQQKATRCIERVAAGVSLDRAVSFPLVFTAKKVGSQGKAAKLRDIVNLCIDLGQLRFRRLCTLTISRILVREVQESGYSAHTFEVRDRRSLDRFVWEELWI